MTEEKFMEILRGIDQGCTKEVNKAHGTNAAYFHILLILVVTIADDLGLKKERLVDVMRNYVRGVALRMGVNSGGEFGDAFRGTYESFEALLSRAPICEDASDEPSNPFHVILGGKRDLGDEPV
jgi:hypothetical protein